MKTLGYILAILFSIFLIWQIYGAVTNKKYENLDTKFLGELGKVRFKIYNQYTKASVNMSGKNMTNAYGKFSVLANYIFGGNTNSTKISMTSPVLYNINNSPTFSFIMPSNFDRENLPIPKNTEIFFKTEYNQCVATIKFGGFANDEKCQKIYDELKELLVLNNISFNENYIIAIYNSPYQLLNRKNEIWIEVNKDQVQKKLDI
jgi:hypothetical protein